MRYRFDSFLLDTDTGQLQREGETIPLRRQTLRLLQHLLEAAPALLDRDTLLDEVWGRSALSPNVVPQAISELRQVLGDSAQSPRFIETRHRLGYRFIATVSVEPQPSVASHPELSAPPETAETDPALPARGAPRGHALRVRRIWIAALATALLGLVALALSPRSAPPALTGPEDPIALALAGFSLDPGVPEWVAPAARELLSRQFGAEPALRLLRAEGLLDSTDLADARWPYRVQDLLGAPTALVGHWRSGPQPDQLLLEFSLVDLGSGRVLLADTVAAPVADLDLLARKVGEQTLAGLRVGIARNRSEPARPESRERIAYWQALADLAAGESESALQALRELDAALGRPLWLEPALVRALRESGQGDEAMARLESRLQQEANLPLGGSLRLRAELARLQHRPDLAAAAWRALVELFPGDLEALLQLADAELEALQGDALRRTLALLEREPRALRDPRLGLLRGRLALIDGESARAEQFTREALGTARSADLPALAASSVALLLEVMAGQGRLGEAVELLGKVETEWTPSLTPLALAELRLRRLAMLREMGRLAEAEAVLETLQQQTLPGTLPLRMAVEAALLHFLQDQPQRSAEALASIAAQVDASGEPDLRIGWFNARGVLSLAQGDTAAASAAFEQAFALARQSGRARRHVGLQVNAGLLLARQRRFAEAESQWQQALAVFESLGDRRGQAVTLGNLAAAASAQGQVARSRELNERALLLLRDLRLPGPMARTAYNIGLIELREGSLARGAEVFAEAAAAWSGENQADLALQAIAARADALRLLDVAEQAGSALDVGSDWIEDAGAAARARWLEAVAEIERERGALESARSRLRAALALRREVGQRAWADLNELALLRLDLLQGGDALAIGLRAEHLAERFRQQGEARDAARAELVAAKSALGAGQSSRAQDRLQRADADLQGFRDLAVEFERDWLRAWAAAPEERPLRLQLLAESADAAGHALFARRAREALRRLTLGEEPEAGGASPPWAPYVRLAPLTPG
jgi:DNA-binding winged helix-turn-helix (wHTH) protein